jgi:hypothetical protein
MIIVLLILKNNFLLVIFFTKRLTFKEQINYSLIRNIDHFIHQFQNRNSFCERLQPTSAKIKAYQELRARYFPS